MCACAARFSTYLCFCTWIYVEEHHQLTYVRLAEDELNSGLSLIDEFDPAHLAQRNDQMCRWCDSSPQDSLKREMCVNESIFKSAVHYWSFIPAFTWSPSIEQSQPFKSNVWHTLSYEFRDRHNADITRCVYLFIRHTRKLDIYGELVVRARSNE